MKAIKKIAIVFCIILTAGIFSGCTFSRYYYEEADKYTAGDAEIKENITDIDIDWLMGAAEIVVSDGDCISVTEINYNKIELTERVKLHYYVDGTTLRIKYCGSSFEHQTLPQKKLTVVLPEKIDLSSLKITSSSADIKVNEIKTKTAMLSSTSGSVTGELEDLDRAQLSSTSGKINIKLGDAGEIIAETTSGSSKIVFGKAENVRADSSSGHISLEGSVFGNVCAETVSGGIEAEIKGETASIELESKSGDITCAARSAEKLKAKSTSGEVNLKAGKANEVNAESTSGKIKLCFDETPQKLTAESKSGSVNLYLPEDAGFTADVSTTSGDFDSDFAMWKNKNKYKANDGSAEFELETTSGNIKIKIK